MNATFHDRAGASVFITGGGNCIAPGRMLTEKQEIMWATAESKAAFLDKQCLRGFMRPQDMIGGTLFLASSASAMMTGQTITIDAGVVGAG
ncbi:SDR family oxidoreductase [Yoonia sp.]|uniref:SDR family oxidoreductase n=1 Tax=Yoonia sp. TaxID=2212373 RepID=UPI0039758B21